MPIIHNFVTGKTKFVPIQINKKYSMKSVFSNNSVYYKPGSFGSSGIGSIQNSNVKSKRI